MKKYILILLTAVTFTIFGLSAGEAFTDTDSPFPLHSPDNTMTFSVADLGNGGDHGVIFSNDAANTASAVILDSAGIPDNSLFGWSYLAADYNALTMSWTSEESNTYTSPYPAQAPDMIFTYSAGELNGFNHAVMYYNQFSNTAMLVVLDPDGFPDSFLLGFPYMAADWNAPGGGTVWYSVNGLSWYCSAGCPQ